MAAKYELYVVDCETTGLDFIKNEPFEISIRRLTTNEQRTWFPRPIHWDALSTDAQRVTGVDFNDVKTNSKYCDPASVLVEIENWLMEDLTAPEDRIITGQNCHFDKMMLEFLWKKCNSAETFPFNKRYVVDTLLIEFFFDFCKGQFADAYNLGALTKKYGVHNEKAHAAEADVKATTEVFMKQVEKFRHYLNK